MLTKAINNWLEKEWAYVVIDGDNMIELLLDLSPYFTIDDIASFCVGNHIQVEEPRLFLTIRDDEERFTNSIDQHKYFLIDEYPDSFSCDYRIVGDGIEKGYSDIVICNDVSKKIDRFDSLFILSSDYDFVQLYNHITDAKRKNCIICGDGQKTSKDLKNNLMYYDLRQLMKYKSLDEAILKLERPIPKKGSGYCQTEESAIEEYNKFIKRKPNHKRIYTKLNP